MTRFPFQCNILAWVRAKFTRFGAFVLVLGLIVGGTAVWLIDPVLVQTVRLAQFDQFQRWHPRPYVAAGVSIVDIDEVALKRVGQWPWPRTRLAELVERLHDAGVKLVAFDVLLTETDRTSPQALAQLWGNPQLSQLLATMPDPDATLAQSMRQVPVLLGSSMRRGAPGVDVQPGVKSAQPYRVVTTGSGNVGQFVPGFDEVLWPLPVLMHTAAGTGLLNAAPDGDGVVRRVPLFLRHGTALLPGLTLEALRVSLGERNYVVRSDNQGVADVRLGAHTLPTNPQGESWLHYTLDQPQRIVSAQTVLDAALAPGQLQGHIVLVGSSASGLMDLWNTPMGYAIPGVVAHAQALEQMLLHHDLVRPAWAPSLEWLILAVGSLLLGWVASKLSVRRASVVLLAVVLALGSFAWFAYVEHRLLLDVSNPALVMLLVFVVASGYHHWSIESQQRWLRTAFSRYVSPNRVQHLMAHPEQLHLGGQRQVCSFVFTDLVDFTPMMESYDPAQVVSLLNDYLEAMLVIVFKHEGTLDRFVGDAMVVLFSAPVFQVDHRQRALDCALEMDAFATSYARRLQASGVPWGLTRIGVHCGEVIVGNFGGKSLFDYRALGDPINTAARLESVNKILGTRMCVSQDLVDGCSGVALRSIGRILLKGKSKSLQIYVPEPTLESTRSADPKDYAAALAFITPGPALDVRAGRAQFEALVSRYPQDPLVQLHLRRLTKGAQDDLIVQGDK